MEATLVTGTGGRLALADGTRLQFPPGSLTRDVAAALDEGQVPPPRPDWGTALGTPVNIDIGNQPLAAPATLELPYDLSKAPPDTSPPFAAYYDDARGEWIPVGGRPDPQRGVVVVQITHASWWAPWTWNWDAWLASLTKVLDLKVKSFVEAVRLLTESCGEATAHVTVDNSHNNSIAKGCIERDDPAEPAVRVVNLKSFYIGVSASGASGATLDTRILRPGDSAHLTLNTSEAPPQRVSLEFTEEAMGAFVVHLVLQMLPAGDLVPEDGAGAILHAVADDAHILAAIEDLSHKDGLAAAGEITAMLKEDAFIEAFVGAAVQYGVEQNIDFMQTWTVSGVKKVLAGVSATNVIIQTVDFIANYFFNNQSSVDFVWEKVTRTFYDPFAYCSAIGTLDEPGSRYVGDVAPIRAGLEARGVRVFGDGFTWRCAAGDVYACSFGVNLNCGAANVSREPSPAMSEFCGKMPDAPLIPASITGHDTIFSWKCTVGRVLIDRQVVDVDERGFALQNWYRLTTPSSNTSPDDAMRTYLSQYLNINPSSVVIGAPAFANCPGFGPGSSNVCFVLVEQRGAVRLYEFGYYAQGSGSRFVVKRNDQWVVLEGCGVESYANCTWPTN